MLKSKPMIIFLERKATKKQIKQLAEHFNGYIKVVVDIEKKMLAGGTDRHFDQEQDLLRKGSKQEDLWGGGVDIETKEIDYNSIINLRPNQDNPSRDILSKDIRLKFNKIIRKLIT